jgi:Mrp family chromosome partitioning ATPase
MSRIEEALRRASLPAGPRPVAAGEDTGELSLPASTLAEYPQEAAAAARARPRRETGATVRSISPKALEVGHLGPFPEAFEGKLILSHAAPVAVEQYRRLAAALHELQAAHGTKVLMVTSSVPREGKTLTVSNLALTLSESYGRRVLLIDADLRRPSVHEVFQLKNTTGLSDGVLPAGRADSNPMAGLTSRRMQTLLEESAREFDWVLLDAPPVGIMPDASLLAHLTQGVIFVIAAGLTPYPLVQRALTDIGREAVVGVVLNRVAAGAMPEGEYYGEYYHSGHD